MGKVWYNIYIKRGTRITSITVRKGTKNMREFKPIPLHSVNADAKINAVLDAVQGKCKARTISAGDIRNAIGKIEKHFGIPKCKLDGARIDCDINAQSFPNAYKRVRKSTIFTAENRKGKWYLTAVRREAPYPPTYAVQVRHMSEEMQDAIIYQNMKFEI